MQWAQSLMHAGQTTPRFVLLIHNRYRCPKGLLSLYKNIIYSFEKSLNNNFFRLITLWLVGLIILNFLTDFTHFLKRRLALMNLKINDEGTYGIESFFNIWGRSLVSFVYNSKIGWITSGHFGKGKSSNGSSLLKHSPPSQHVSFRLDGQ